MHRILRYVALGVVSLLGSGPAAAQVWEVGNQLLQLPPDRLVPSAAFGRALAVGDFDGNGVDDLVVGAPGWVIQAPDILHGAIEVFFGSPASGLGAGSLVWYNSSAPDETGKSVAAGDFDGDGWGDLAVGAMFVDLPEAPNAGAVQVLYGGLFADGFEGGALAGW